MAVFAQPPICLGIPGSTTLCGFFWPLQGLSVYTESSRTLGGKQWILRDDTEVMDATRDLKDILTVLCPCIMFRVKVMMI